MDEHKDGRDLDKTVETIKSEIRASLLETFSEKVVNAWLDPVHFGSLERPEGSGKAIGECGEEMEMALRVRHDCIVEAKFLTDGCITSVAAGNMAAELATGKTVTEAFEISHEAILKALDGLPEESAHCALLASNALKAALRASLLSKREPWRAKS